MTRLLAVVLLVLILSFHNVETLNLAYKKPTWQSSKIYSSDKAVDGQYGNLSAAGYQCAISHGSPTDVTWMVDLEGIQSIKFIMIHYRTENEPFANSVYASRFLGFSVYVSNTTNKENGHLCYQESNHTIANISEKKLITCEVQGRFVIYYNTREGNLRKKPGYSEFAHIDLCEVQVIGCHLGFYSMDCSKKCHRSCRHCSFLYGICLGGCNPGYEGRYCEIYRQMNLALYRPTFQLHTLLSRQPSSRLVDGKKSDRKLDSNQCSSTSDGQTFAMWRVDLLSNRRIERIIVYSRTDNQRWDVNNSFTEKLLGFTIIVSNTTDHTDGVVCFHDIKYNKYTIPSVVNIFCQVIGRYVTYYTERLPGISYPKGYSTHAYVDLCEIEVYGCPLPSFGYEDPECTIPCFEMCRSHFENLSYMKPTWQSSTASSMDSSKAVDGRRQPVFCTSTSPERTVTWWVNLGRIHRIHSIALYFRTDGREWNFNNGYAAYYLGFSLYISNTTNRNDGVLCHKDETFTKNTMPSSMTIDCEHPGQYVIYYNERLRWVTYPDDYSTLAHGDLCEVEVLGCPSPVADIPQCSKPCPSNCEQCYPNTGMCKTCKLGYKGYACEWICQAIVNIKVNPTSAIDTSNYMEMLTSKGLTFPSTGDVQTVYIYMALSEQSKDLSNMSIKIDNAMNFNVELMANDMQSKKYDGPSYGPPQREFTLQNGFNTKVFAIRVTVVHRKPIRISNLKLPLRICYRDTAIS